MTKSTSLAFSFFPFSTRHLKHLRLTLFIFSCFFIISCQKNNTSSLEPSPKATASFIKGTVDGDEIPLFLGAESIKLDENRSFLIKKDLTYPTIFNLEINNSSNEIFLIPGETLEVIISLDTLTFKGNLFAENQHLQADKALNEGVNKFLRDNWYNLHSKDETEFVNIIDSIKGLYFNSLETAAQQGAISQDFREVNTAAVHYSFDRMLLRYPQWHQRFTGNTVQLSQSVLEHMSSTLDAPQFLYLESYQKYVQTFLDQAIEKQLSEPSDTTFYGGKLKTERLLSIIDQNFESPETQDFWTFEVIKDHIEQYTWVNATTYLEAFKTGCSTPYVCNEIAPYEQALLEERKGHDINIYKKVKGQILEAHIFKPSDFDDSKSYPALAAFHGGGWQAGDASWTFSSARHAAENGFIGIAIEYRLSNKADITPVEAMEDTRDAIRWIRQNADSLQIDPNKIVGKGLSAGGHLISAITVLQDSVAPYDLMDIPNALVLVSPAIDTKDDYVKSLLQGRTPPREISALDNLKPGLQMPPTLILQGRTDRMTPTSFAEQFRDKMNKLGYPCELKVYEGCGHLFTPSHLDDTGMPQGDPKIVKLALDEQTRFLKVLGM